MKNNASIETKLHSQALPKVLTGIPGLDDITHGGLPQGRPTLLCGNAGCGKTMISMEFLVHGTIDYNEPGVFMSFEENADELTTNFASLGHDLPALIAQDKLAIDFVYIERSEIEESGEYNLDGLFIRLGYAIDRIGAKRVVLDTIEALFSGLSNTAILRAELRRLFRWLKEKGVTAIITAERGDNSMTRFGLEEYVADCVILLNNRIDGEMATRRLRIIKYRGSAHGTSEYPFLIDEGGISLLPLSSVGLTHEASTERVSSGLPELDKLLDGKGYFRGSSILLSGTAGTGKSSFAAFFADGAISRGEKCLWFAFEESGSQIIRNMRSIGIDLEPAVLNEQLIIVADRPTMCGSEMHLLNIHNHVNRVKPQVVIIDPITNFTSLGNMREVKDMLVRLIDFLKMQQITTLFTNLTLNDAPAETTDVGVSSLMDSWLLLKDSQHGVVRDRELYILKSRGMAHSNLRHRFLLTDHGVELMQPPVKSTREKGVSL